jgi:hypothetical protein
MWLELQTNLDKPRAIFFLKLKQTVIHPLFVFFGITHVLLMLKEQL